MSLPAPHPGLVIRYAYLWKREYEAGREEGSKDRPCAIVMAVTDGEGEAQVLVLPITHTAPYNAAEAVEIPRATQQRLGLDGERSWIMITEVNEFIWPGPDLRPVPGGDGSIVYGVLPPGLFDEVRKQFLARIAQGGAVRVPRTE
ncbi:MAG: hypothetical protein KIT37_09590 [Steroidobacteraceae bacterium]|nr:hypothetical protein [Steroidobacteraceae bacterium]